MRTGRGSKTGKMPPEAVANFKAEMFDGEPLRAKAKRYPVTPGVLGYIRAGYTWTDIPAADKADKTRIWEAV